MCNRKRERRGEPTAQRVSQEFIFICHSIAVYARERILSSSRNFLVCERKFSSFAFLASFELLSCVHSVTVEFFSIENFLKFPFLFGFELWGRPRKCQRRVREGFRWTNKAKNSPKCKQKIFHIYIIFFSPFEKKNQKRKIFPFFSPCLARESVCVRENWEELFFFFVEREKKILFLVFVIFVLNAATVGENLVCEKRKFLML